MQTSTAVYFDNKNLAIQLTNIAIEQHINSVKAQNRFSSTVIQITEIFVHRQLITHSNV